MKRTLLDHFKTAPQEELQTIESDDSSSGSPSSTAPVPSPVSTSSSKDSEILEPLTDEEKEVVSNPGSLVWFFFEKIGENRAKCKTCNTKRKTPTGTTSTLVTHLNSHPTKQKQYEKMLAHRKKLKEKTLTPYDKNRETQTKLMPGRFGVLPFHSNRAKDITKTIGVFLAKGLHPYSTVSEPGFKHLLRKLEPRYVVPHRTTFSRYVIPNLFKEEKQKQAELLKSSLDYLESITLISDMWTSRARDAFISCDVQFIQNMDDKFDLLNLTVDCKPFPGSHTAARICEFAFEMVLEVGVDPNKVKIYFVSEAALEQPTVGKTANVSLPAILREEKPWSHLPCFDHTLQLAISDTRKEVGAHTIIEKAAAIIVIRYSQSSTARENLKKFQKASNTVEHEMIRNVATRWNSEYAMLERLLEQKIPVTMEMADAGEENLNTSQWKMVEGYVKVLKPIAQFTAELGSTSQPTLSMVIPVIHEIKSSLQDFLKKPSNKGSGVVFARTLLKFVTERFPDESYKFNELYQTATLMDPRLKDLLMETRHAAVLLEHEALKKMRQQNRRKCSIDSDTCMTAESNNPSTSPRAKQSKWGHIHKLSHGRKSDNNEDEHSIIAKEVETYLQMPVIDANTADPLAWWRANKKSFPHLMLVATEYLGIAATEVQSERDFTSGSNTCTSQRTDLLPEHIRQFVFLYRNLKVPVPADMQNTLLIEDMD